MRACCILLAAASCSAQVAAFHSTVELVPIPCSVVDSRGAPVHDLGRDEFRVFDNGTRRIIDSFWVDRDTPLTLGIIIDASESQEDRIASHRETALQVLERLLKPGDHAFLVSVHQTVRLSADLSETADEVRRKMNAGPGVPLGDQCPAAACGNSPLWNAVYETARVRMSSLTGSKALLILTDGFDSGSSHAWRQAADEAARAATVVYALQYPAASGNRYAPDLYRLVEDAGGAVFEPSTDQAAILSRIETDLRRRYVLGVQPEQLSGKLRHDIRVEVTRPDLVVRARKTYFRPAR